MRIRFFFLLLFCSSAVIADSKINQLYEYYDISPKTKYDIKSEIQENTPIIHNGIRFDGFTTWQVKWSIAWQKSQGICYLYTSDVELDVLFKMPRILPEDNSSDSVVNTFDKYYKALLNHEKGHMENGVNALRDIELLLSNFNSYQNCEVLNATVEKSITTVVEKYKQLDIAYDLKTKHGKAQGVSMKEYL